MESSLLVLFRPTSVAPYDVMRGLDLVGCSTLDIGVFRIGNPGRLRKGLRERFPDAPFSGILPAFEGGS
jgi:hypothetical protein